ncbi:MAG: sensor histidine kinase [archaeon]
MYLKQTQPVIEEPEALKREQLLEKRFDELVSSITTYVPHELRTPLVSIMGFTQIIMDEIDSLSKDDIRYMAHNINRSSRRLYNTVEKFINFTEAECLYRDKRMKNQIEESSMNAHTKAVIDTIMPMAEKEDRTDDLTLYIEDAELQIPDHYLKLISKELFDNALKFSSPGSRIEVTGKKGQYSYSMEIKDQGSGMTQEEISSILPFRQFNRQTIQQDGNGLGLSIVKRLADVFDCGFCIESRTDAYTTVTIDFPYKNKYREAV